jgi:RNAse (barnase) inhibitor barstar
MTAPGFDFATFDASTIGTYLVSSDDLAMFDAPARKAGRLVRRADLRGCRDKVALLQRIAAAFDFPSAFGRNWDALSDCLRDFGWLPATGYVFLLDHVDDLRAADAAAFDTLIDLFDEAANAWNERDVPFWAFFGLSDSTLDALDG